MAVGIAAFFLSSCGETTDDQLVVYSGRSQGLVDPLVEDFKEQTGINIEVRYGNDAELLAVMSEEGDQSPADVYWANTTGALANASQKGKLVTLPDSLTSKPASYTSSSGEWIPVTVRFRTLAYNPNTVDPEDLPESVMDLPDMDDFDGRIGWTPTYSSFYDFMTSMRLIEGEDVAKEWLEGMMSLNPKSYSSNTPMLQALAGGEIDIALTNHYYILRMKHGSTGTQSTDTDSDTAMDSDSDTSMGSGEIDPNATVEMYHFAEGDVGNLAMVTGAAQLATSDNAEKAQQFLSFLLSKQAQKFAAESVHEYPVIRDVELPDYMLDAEKAFELSPEYDYEQLKQLEGTLNLLREVGLI
ncbi:iron ABC transporter substrate-binding protein [Fodinibius sp.]|uniref:iron ABC transporter substrate-binding protein n=1 Tax=Fodinibius sp. TaxID=1872440 RepID=UPI002ACEF2CA|nr:iron ABC transporter substrate-binding protein [Fodinibius sp.]MDZ7658212.1 iron ABC transporter substrate-binding protein [Fodinibius sp.]